MSNALLALIAQRKAQTTQAKALSPNAGRNRYRILPSWRKDASKGPQDQFWMDFGQHFIKDAAGAVKAVYVCVDKTYNRPCPICDEVARGIEGSNDDMQKKRIEDMKSSARVLLNVLHLDGPTPKVPQVLQIAPTVFNGNKGVGGIIQGFEDWPDMVSLEKGCDVIIEKAGTGKDTRYGVSFVQSKMGALDPAIMGQIQDLDAFVAQENDAGAQRALAGVAAATGMLPMSPRPALTASAAAAFVSNPKPAVEVFEDVPSFPTAAEVAAQPVTAAAPVQHPVTAAAPAVQPVVVTAVADAELADLLKDL